MNFCASKAIGNHALVSGANNDPHLRFRRLHAGGAMGQQTVLDSTMWSGSTGVACINTGRDFIGIEMDREHFDIARERISNS